MIDPDAVLGLTDEEAYALYAALRRREVMRDAELRIEAVSEEYLTARDGHAPDPATATTADYPAYVQPTGAHDAYPQGRIICWDEKLYRAVRTGVAHNPSEAPEEWQEAFLVDGGITTERPVNPETGTPDYPDYDPSKTYYPNPGNSPLVIVKHDGKLWELIHSVAAPNYAPGGAGMHAVWREYTP